MMITQKIMIHEGQKKANLWKDIINVIGIHFHCFSLCPSWIPDSSSLSYSECNLLLNSSRVHCNPSSHFWLNHQLPASSVEEKSLVSWFSTEALYLFLSIFLINYKDDQLEMMLMTIMMVETLMLMMTQVTPLILIVFIVSLTLFPYLFHPFPFDPIFFWSASNQGNEEDTHGE